MITQFYRIKTKTNSSIYSESIEDFVSTQSNLGYELKVDKIQILDDYISSPKLLITSVVPVYDSPYEEESIILAMALGWKFKCCGRAFEELEQFEIDKKKTKWNFSWSWDICYPLGIKDIVERNKLENIKTAFIGYRMDEIDIMTTSDYSGTSIDAMEYTKQFCKFVSDRSFNNFAFSELLLEIIKTDIKDFLDKNKEKYFERKK